MEKVDALGTPLEVGQKVLWGKFNSYSGFSKIYEVHKLTEKRVLLIDPNSSIPFPSHTFFNSVVVVDDLLEEEEGESNEETTCTL